MQLCSPDVALVTGSGTWRRVMLPPSLAQLLQQRVSARSVTSSTDHGAQMALQGQAMKKRPDFGSQVQLDDLLLSLRLHVSLNVCTGARLHLPVKSGVKVKV